MIQRDFQIANDLYKDGSYTGGPVSIDDSRHKTGVDSNLLQTCQDYGRLVNLTIALTGIILIWNISLTGQKSHRIVKNVDKIDSVRHYSQNSRHRFGLTREKVDISPIYTRIVERPGFNLE